MDKKKKDEVDYAAAFRQFMNFGHGRSLKQFCEDEDYDYGKLQRYSRKAFWSKYTKLNESEVEESQFMPLVHNDGQSISPSEEESPSSKQEQHPDTNTVINATEISFIKVRFKDGL